MTRSFHPLTLLAVFALGAPSSAQELPEALDRFLMTERSDERRFIEATVGGLEVFSMKIFSDLPSLVWPQEGTTLEENQRSIERWLRASSNDLGHAGLTLTLEGQDNEGNGITRWDYSLGVDGVPVFGYGVRVYFEGGVFQGILNDMPGPTASIRAYEGDAPSGAQYLALRDRDGGYRIEPTTVSTSTNQGLRRSTLTGSQFSVSSVSWTSGGAATDINPIDYEMTVWPIAMGTFPDQIDTDSKGNVWFSQPSNDVVTRFNPRTEVFTSYLTQVGGVPDGLIVSSDDIVYSGLYNIGRLGALDISTFTHTSYQAPHSGATMAIPTETSLGTIIVTDHSGTVVEWDPGTQTFVRTWTTPTSNPHIVAGVEDENQVMWFTEYNANKLARLDLNTGQFTEINIPGGGGPAFPAISGGKVWFSLWLRDEMGVYDPATGNFVFYDFGIGNELGGPLFTAPSGDVICGTRGPGQIVVWDAAFDALRLYSIPHPSPGLKDGLTVDADGAVWYTLTGAARIGRLLYPD